MSFVRLKELVEEAVRKIGVDPTRVLAQNEADKATWSLQRGSAQVLVNAQVRDGNAFLRVVSPIMMLPSGPDTSRREALFVRALELNATGIGNCAFGLVGERLVAVSERPAEGLDVGEVEQIVRLVAAVADTYDDRFVNEFGGKKASDKS
jgi:hypothetical protein